MTATALGGCESVPHGPGELAAVVEGSDLGGVLLEVSGRGIQGFEGRGSTLVYAAPITTAPHSHRVVLIDPDGTGLRFGMSMADVAGETPVLYVVEATGMDDLPRPAAGIVARIER